MHCTRSPGCYCRAIRYEVNVDSPDDLRTSLCHCKNCKKFTGGPYGVTTKLPLQSFKITVGEPASHSADNGSGSLLHRLFCKTCGGPIAEWGDAAKDTQRYIFTGTFDDIEQEGLRPKGEFFTSRRAGWLVPVEGCFQKKEIKD
ncbi:hypothetical protein NBRC10512_005818 [Rhodotorula toruloides]|uniref:RHTO0S21e02256g1_1 n=2 Tax=Rhodotorula toruloides TaxID=5286 RepID=A0A061BPF9_RHOTO|nr:protein of GFA family [Rhodotorula toruloides NP11]EMS18767.1 protein of GFA family [Rhodotorula toruloides NP11]KAJ8294814.1 hypothetical protein OF846_001890 [Rhodotorula toruloides]CDR48947.1 RHTO0S21e02256g1_1 [Rhodotorula toruloides]